MNVLRLVLLITGIVLNMLKIECKANLRVTELLEVTSNSSTSSLSVPVMKLTEHKFPLPLCYSDTNATKMALTALFFCRENGFHALQRLIPVYKQELNVIPGMGLKWDVHCEGYGRLLSQCRLDSVRTSVCRSYLGVLCAGCNHTIKIEAHGKQEIEFPILLPCEPGMFCEWRTLMEDNTKGMMVLELHDMDADNVSKSWHLEITWFNLENQQWNLQTVDENTSTNLGKLIIPSNEMILRYYTPSCHLVGTKHLHATISSSGNFQKDISHHNMKSYMFYAILSCGILIMGFSILMSCVCCHRQKKKGKSITWSNILGRRKSSSAGRNFDDGRLTVAFRGFISTSRQLLNVSEEPEAEQFQLGLETADSSPVFRTRECNGEGSKKRCSSFEVRSGLPFSHGSEAINITSYKQLDKRSSETTVKDSNGSSSPEVWGSPHSEAEMMQSCKSSDSDRSFFSLWQYSCTVPASEAEMKADSVAEHGQDSELHKP